jgi:topoisomerase-4 subunit A
VVAPDQTLLLWAGDRKMTLKYADLKEYRGERAQRGAVLPRGWRGVQKLEVEMPPAT